MRTPADWRTWGAQAAAQLTDDPFVAAELAELSAGICVGERGPQLTADVGILERLHGTVDLRRLHQAVSKRYFRALLPGERE